MLLSSLLSSCFLHPPPLPRISLSLPPPIFFRFSLNFLFLFLLLCLNLSQICKHSVLDSNSLVSDLTESFNDECFSRNYTSFLASLSQTNRISRQCMKTSSILDQTSQETKIIIIG